MISKEEIKNWHDRREFDEIISAITALDESQLDSRLLGSLSAAYSNTMQYEKGREVLLRIDEEDRNEPLWHFRMGYTLFFIKDYAEAKFHFEKSKELGELETTPFENWIAGLEKFQQVVENDDQTEYSNFEPDLHTDVVDSIKNHFEFLRLFGFGRFEYKQHAYENHYVANNDFCQIDIWFESFSSSPIWIRLNGYFLNLQEPENAKIKEYNDSLEHRYSALFQKYLDEDDTSYLSDLKKVYAEVGREINDGYLQELSHIIKRNISLLHGDVEVLKSNFDAVAEQNKQEITDERIKNKIYTMEYQFENGNGMVFEDEFENIEEIKEFLEDNDDVEKYTIKDWNQNEIDIPQT